VVDREQVLHVARLAKLRLSEAEIGPISAQLGRILEYVEMLRELDPEPPAAGSGASASSGAPGREPRPDEPRPSLPRTIALELAPETDGEAYLVPPVIDGGGSA
jgi:aspartyl-tRNA(Asn)/glutamyl-tRNA(Gln) amidotransferase subunit C